MGFLGSMLIDTEIANRFFWFYDNSVNKLFDRKLCLSETVVSIIYCGPIYYFTLYFHLYILYNKNT